MSKRKKISKEAEKEILYKSARRCCLCYGLFGDFNTKKGQIAHINRNPDNNDIENLVFLCFVHHDIYDSITSQSKGFTEAELILYRNILYTDVENQLPRLEEQSKKQSEKRTDNVNSFHLFINSLRDNIKINSTFLNDYEIERSIEQEYLEIKPFDEHNLGNASYDFTLGEEAMINNQQLKISQEKPLKIPHNSSTLVISNEFIAVPKGLFCRYFPGSNIIRSGINPFCGGHIDSGYMGRIVTSLINNSANDIILDLGQKIITIEFCLLSVSEIKGRQYKI